MSIEAHTAPIDGRRVEYYWAELGARKEQPDLYVIAFTGNAGRAETMVPLVQSQFGPWLAAHPGRSIAVAALQYPGYGDDRESASLAGNLAAARTLYREVRDRAGDRPIVIYGLSLGSIFALDVARTNGAHPAGPAALILEKPPDLRGMILGQHGWWNLWLLAGPVALGVPADACSNRQAAQITSTPALFFVARDDEVVPASNSERVYASYAADKRIVYTKGGHNTPASVYPGREFMDGLRWLLDPLVTD